MARGLGETNAGLRKNEVGILVPAGKKIIVPNGSEDFRVREDERTGLRLIFPGPVKQRWSRDELWYRSLLVDKEDRVVSAGWPKFFNLGENEEDSSLFNHALKNKDNIMFFEKMDGSLCIRSVVDWGEGAKVIFRTRGTSDGGDIYGPAMKKIAEEKYPQLFDPSWMNDRSLLFEFVHPHPDFRIIVKYDEPNLVFLGGVKHDSLHLLTWNEMEQAAGEGDLQLVERHDLPQDIDGLAAAVIDWDDKEGIVARFGDEQTYVKLKSAPYLAQHSMKFNFGPRRALEVCMQNDFETPQEFIDHLLGLGMDYELAEVRLPYFELYDRARSSSIVLEKLSQEFYDSNIELLNNSDPKIGKRDYALKVQEVYKGDKLMQNFCFAHVANSVEKIRASAIKNSLDVGLKNMGVEDLDEN